MLRVSKVSHERSIQTACLNVNFTMSYIHDRIIWRAKNIFNFIKVLVLRT